MGSIYYHGTDRKTSEIIFKKGFKAGTYFTWDLHSALVMGGQYIFGLYFKDKEITDYWEWISDKVIPPEKILYLRKFDIDCLFDNEKEQEYLKELTHKEYYGDNVIHCINCKGKGQLNKAPGYAWHPRTKLIACNVCGGFGCLSVDGGKLNE